MRLKFDEYENRYRTLHSYKIMSFLIRALQCILTLFMTITLRAAKKTLQ